MLKHTFRFVLSMIALALVLGPVTALQAADDDKPKEMKDHMEIISRNMKKLKKDVADSSKNEASAKLAAEACTHAAAAKGFVPEKAKEVPADKREKFVAEFKAMMDELIANFKKLEAALKEGKNDEAQKIYDTLMGMKKTGHDKFTE